MREFEVEIDGAVFTVKQIAPEDGTAEYGEKEAELVSRACLLYEEEAEKKAYAPKKAVPNEEVLPEKAREKVTEILREKITEKHVAVQLEEMKAAQAEPSEKAVNYRRQIEELSRYLSRDSRRYDGYFEMY